MAGISPSVELIDDAACELIGIGPERAGEYAVALAADGLELPEGWSAEAAVDTSRITPAQADPHGGLVGWDVILVSPRTPSIVRCELVDYYYLRREYRLSVEGADPDAVECDPELEETRSRQEWLAQAHVRAAGQAAGELTRLLDAGAPRVLDHPLDSEGNLLQHTHLVLGAHRRDGYPLAPGRMEAVARWAIAGYYRRLRELVSGGLCWRYRWGRPDPDGRIELVGLPEELVDAYAGRFRPLREVGRVIGRCGGCWPSGQVTRDGGSCQARGGPVGLLHPRTRPQPRTVPVRQGRGPWRLPRRQRPRARPGRGVLAGGVQAAVRLAGSPHRRAVGAGAAHGCHARLGSGVSPAQGRVDPVWPGGCADLAPGGGRASGGRQGCGCLPGRAGWHPHRPPRCRACAGRRPARRWVHPSDQPRQRPAAAHPPDHRQPHPRTGRCVAHAGRAGGVPASAGGGCGLPGDLPDGAVADAGVRWAPADRWGNRAIQGMPEELRRGFSKRHQQISAELQRQEAQGKHRTSRLVRKVVHETRPAKTHETPETLYGRWQQEARELGFEPERLVLEVSDPTRARE